MAERWGLRFTHLDSHMGVVGQQPQFFKIYLDAAKKHQVIAGIPKWMLWEEEGREIFSTSNFPLIDEERSSGVGINLISWGDILNTAIT